MSKWFIWLIFLFPQVQIPAEGDVIDELLQELKMDEKSVKEKLKKGPPKNVKLYPGFKSTVDLECLTEQNAKWVYEVQFEHLLKWAKLCRKQKIKGCKVEAKKQDPACDAQLKTYYMFVMTPNMESKILNVCMDYSLSCPKAEAKEDRKN